MNNTQRSGRAETGVKMSGFSLTEITIQTRPIVHPNLDVKVFASGVNLRRMETRRFGVLFDTPKLTPKLLVVRLIKLSVR